MKKKEEVKKSSRVVSPKLKFIALKNIIKKTITKIIMNEGLLKYKYKFALK